MDNEEYRYLEQQFRAVHDRLDNIDARLNGIDDRITTNAKEKLADIQAVRRDLEEHVQRNHGASKVATGGLAGAIAAIVVAVVEALKRLAT